MPVAGEENYEKLIQCPYDKSHQVRQGRMQFHLSICRKNFPNTELVQCPFNTTHVVRKAELEFHKKYCPDRKNWERFTYKIGNTNCPVRDLVPVAAPVAAATVPDGDENWDNFETEGSLLDQIKTEAENKDIIRMKQCESKSIRKKFRKQETKRHRQYQSPGKNASSSSTSSVSVSGDKPLPKPQKKTIMPLDRQDPAVAIAALNSEFKSLDLHVKPSTSSDARSVALSMGNEFPSEATTPPIAEPASSSHSSMNFDERYFSGPSTAMSSALLLENRSAPSSPSSLSSAMPAAMVSQSGRRPNTARSIIASGNRAAFDSSVDSQEVSSGIQGFCQIPIPGLGRGRGVRPRQKRKK